MDELPNKDGALREFVFNYEMSIARKPTEKELAAILACEENKPIEILPDGRIVVFENSFAFAQAVAAFTEKRVLDELKFNGGLSFCHCGPPDFCEGCKKWHQLINEREAALAQAGKEKENVDKL